MPYKSRFPSLDVPKCNVLSYLFSDTPSEKPLWIDAANPTESLSPAQTLSWVKRFAVGLDNLGVPEGGAVMIITPNHIYIPVVYLAVVGSKRCFTGVNPAFTEDEISYQMKAVDPVIILVHPTALKAGINAAKSAQIPIDRLYLFSNSVCPPAQGIQDWRTIAATPEASSSWQWDPLHGEAALTTIAVINFSSGTTGFPKGVCITHHNLVANAAQTVYGRFHQPNGPDLNPAAERWMNFLPFYHAYSQLWAINVACKMQIPTYVMEKFNFEDFLQYIERHRITAIQAVPPVLVMLSKRPETKKYEIRSLRHVVCGAAPLSESLQNEVSSRFGIVVAQGWGMSEVTCAGTLVPGNMEDRTGSVGYLLPNSEAKLIDEDGREVLEEGKPGELWVRGPQVMLKYWKNEEATAETKTADGWLRTGDVAVVKNDMFTIVDRKKELIKVNGLQVAPAELEAVLLKLEAVADAAAVGVVIHGEEVPRAYVVLQPFARGKTTEEDIQSLVASRVAKHKRLTGGVKFVDEIPKLASGKIVRKLVKEWEKKDVKNAEIGTKARL